MFQVVTASFLLFLSSVQAVPAVGTGPEPMAQRVSWELDFKFHDPQRIEIQLPDRAEPEVYWYMLYTVTNNSERTQFFCPTFQLVMDDLRVIDTDKDVSKLVFDAIKARHRHTHKYLVHPTQAIGELLRGDDHARESVAIWKDVDLTSNNFTIYVAGLSGETRFVPNPAYDPSKPETAKGDLGEVKTANPRHFALRKTLAIRYNLPGSSQTRVSAEPQRVDVRWVLR